MNLELCLAKSEVQIKKQPTSENATTVAYLTTDTTARVCTSWGTLLFDFPLVFGVWLSETRSDFQRFVV